MEENLRWLWVAFTIAWGLHIAYLVSLAGRTRRLQRQIDDLRAQMKDDRSADSSPDPA